jgi:hypothetical protein
MEKMTLEEKEMLEEKHNVYIDIETETFNHDQNAVYGWIPIPKEWYLDLD